jgi:tetratricopeptide (TPR) repeat protein
VKSSAATTSLRRGQLLLNRSRPDLAERELRQALAEEPNHATAHALLGVCLGRLGRWPEALAEAEMAVHLAPANAYAHYVLAWVLYKRGRLDAASSAIVEALRLSPEEPNYLAHLAAIRFDQHHWQAALEAAERGLQLDAEHAPCSNLRAMALVKLGRADEAQATVAGTLARQPESALSHANLGWVLLNQGQAHQALEHFREALRLDPTSAWARNGTIEALKARHRVYALLLRYVLWRSRLPRSTQWLVTVAGMLILRTLLGATLLSPILAIVVAPLLLAYGAFILLTWVGDPIFTLLLRTDRFGRLLVSDEQVARSNWVAAALLGAIVSGVVVGWRAGAGDGLLAAAACVALALPLSQVHACARGWPRRSMLVVTGLVAVLTGLAVVRAAVTPGRTTNAGLLLVALFSAIGAIWIGNLLGLVRRRR